jgi:hypothetical protein
MKTTLSLHSKVAVSLDIAVIDADDTVNGAGVGLGAFDSAMVVIQAGTIADGTHTFEVQDSNDNSTFAAVASAYLEGAEPALTDADSDTVTVIGYKGTKKYLRVSVTSATTTDGGTFGALVICGDPTRAPVVR